MEFGSVLPFSNSVYAPVNLPTPGGGGGGGGHTRGFRQKTNADRREFDKLMESDMLKGGI